MEVTKPDSAAVYRLDRFSVPEPARAAFLDRVRDTHRFLRQQPGFVRDLLLESPRSDDHFTLVTLVEWRDSLSVERARAAVAARYDRDNFDPRALMAQLGIQADIGNFTRADH